MARPMVLEFQSDPTTYPLDLQYMFGDSLLVAPVVSRTNRCQVYLPDGEWIDYWTKEVQTGPRWLEVEAPLDVLPLWVRAGAIVAMGPHMDHAEEKPLDSLTLELYLPQGESETLVYNEDNPDIPVRYSRRGPGRGHPLRRYGQDSAPRRAATHPGTVSPRSTGPL
jgi:alpha-glucosidase (family GH31 glycosyl hydrolase)